VTVSGDVRDALHRLDRAEGLGAVVARDDDAVLAEARRLDAVGEDRGRDEASLWGRPVTVKDWIDVVGFPCEGESSRRLDRWPERDATVVARLRAAGAVVVAKTQPGAHHPQHGRCRHPLDPARSPGGSSSGEAALIGAGASTLGLGSDSGGSIRLPAAWCGVAGLKPSYGRVPVTGHYPRIGGREDGRTVIGPLAATVDDLALALAIIAGPDGVDPDGSPVALGDIDAVALDGLRVAVVGAGEAIAPAPSTTAAVTSAAASLVSAGAVVVDDGLPPHLAESYDITDRYWRRRSLSGVEIDDHLRAWDRFAGRLTRSASSFDVVVGPVVRDVAPLDRPIVGEDYAFTLPWSLTGWPAASVPFGHDPQTGLPLAVQVAAPRWRDDVVLAVARHLERSAADRSGPGRSELDQPPAPGSGR
jgi:amidase